MIIEKKPAFWVGDSPFTSAEKAQVAALENLLVTKGDAGLEVNASVAAILANREAIMEILSLTPTTPKPRKPRSDKGTKRQGKTLVEVFAAEQK